MKLFLIIVVVLLALVSVVQNQTIITQHQTIQSMTQNPACMVAPITSPNPELPRRLI